MYIWYSVCGEGLGHASRSIPIINLLRENDNNVKVFTYGHARHMFENFTSIPGINFTEQISYIDLFKQYLNLRQEKHHLFETLCVDNVPDLIISDFEPLLVEHAKKNNIPCICIDNQHKFMNIDWSLPWGLLIYNILLTFYMKRKFNVPSITTTFHSANPTTIFPVINENSMKRKKIVVYVRGCYLYKVIESCRLVNADFVVYTNHQISPGGVTSNVVIKKQSNEFKKDLQDCDGVILNSGNQLISECIDSQKRMLCFPIPKQYEQHINTHYVKKYGYGMTTTFKKFNHKQIEEAFSICPKRMTKTRLLATIYNLYSSQTFTLGVDETK